MPGQLKRIFKLHPSWFLYVLSLFLKRNTLESPEEITISDVRIVFLYNQLLLSRLLFSNVSFLLLLFSSCAHLLIALLSCLYPTVFSIALFIFCTSFLPASFLLLLLFCSSFFLSCLYALFPSSAPWVLLSASNLCATALRQTSFWGGGRYVGPDLYQKSCCAVPRRWWRRAVRSQQHKGSVFLRRPQRKHTWTWKDSFVRLQELVLSGEFSGVVSSCCSEELRLFSSCLCRRAERRERLWWDAQVKLPSPPQQPVCVHVMPGGEKPGVQWVSLADGIMVLAFWASVWGEVFGQAVLLLVVFFAGKCHFSC